MKKNKILTGTVIVIVVAVIAVICAVCFMKGKKTQEPRYTVTEDDNSFIFTDETGESVSVEGTDYMASLDESRFIIVNNGVLSYFAKGEAKELAKGVLSCSLSNNGMVAAYIIPNSSEKLYEGTLYVYNGKNGKTKEICNTAFVGSLSTIQISPSGDTIAYAKNYDYDAATYDCCYFNGKENTIGQNRNIVAISDGGKYIYYNIENPGSEALYSAIFAVYSRKNGEVILDNEAYSNRMYLNLDYSECVFYKGKDSDELYISRDGEEGEVYAENDKEFDTSSLVSHVNPVINVKSFE